ncbi:ATP-dependent protease La domain-containing protein [Podospora didyma]|uniref:ATP-dependent protease La domain-containing protein n=1 Tax=Podospora didyma TaxID=330526 RepID=A0AAE0KET4_9PEZI|nr:ATP-dependent protease La domain-containing protein [Podospora didyma]
MSNYLVRRRPASPSPVTSDDEEDYATTNAALPSRTSSEQARQVIRLIQCPICSLPLQDPFTLPCGRSLCRKCLPEPHLRTNISYPATENRLQGLLCPFPDCRREHAIGDCSPDVTLSRVLDVIDTEFEKSCGAVLEPNLVTHLITKDEWEVTGVPSLREPETISTVLPGGKLLATFRSAKRGDLEYNTEVTYMNPITGAHVAFDTAVLAQVQEAVRTELDCQICYALFCDPVTTPCGHTFCRSCLQRVLDHARDCPVCRRTLAIRPMVDPVSSPSNQPLSKIIRFFWAELLDSRKQVVIDEDLHIGDRDYDIPVFVCTISFPSVPTFLHVFEPRYRLMIRRALEGDRTFGMVLSQGGRFKELGTVLRIVNAEFFHDGRSLVETVGVSRFQILQHGILDGYTVAKIRKINDISIAEEEEREARETRGRIRRINPTPTNTPGSPKSRGFPTSLEEVEHTSTKVLMEFGADFVQRMREQSVGWLTGPISTIYGDCPHDPALFPWWFASILPVKDSEKYRLLSTTSVRERLKICCGWIFECEASSW